MAALVGCDPKTVKAAVGRTGKPKAKYPRRSGSLEWLRQRRNVALVGPPGNGKSHLAVALGRVSVEDHRVRFFRPTPLVEQLYRGLADNTVGRVIDGILRADLVVIDKLGFSTLDPVVANHLFCLIAAAYETRSLPSHPTGPASSGPTSYPMPPPLPPSSTACYITVRWWSSTASPTGYVKRRGVVARP